MYTSLTMVTEVLLNKFFNFRAFLICMDRLNLE